ncbi:MAG: PAS domain S-box protein, partial [Proteobacteria bacterium]|nr:PAS domain S-box protein [Pseudomonadota bacterium]
MRILRDVSIGIKVLIPSFILLLALGIVSSATFYGLYKQREILVDIHEISSNRTGVVRDLILRSETVNSDVFKISVLSFMKLPRSEIQPIYGDLELRINDLKIVYGKILTRWPLDKNERRLLGRMKKPMDVFIRQALQAAELVLENPSFGVVLVRSADASFQEFRNQLEAFSKYQQTRIIRAVDESERKADTIKYLTVFISMLTGILALLTTISIGSLFIARPIRYLTETIGRITEGELAVSVDNTNRFDEIGSIAQAVETFRLSAVAKKEAEEALRDSEERYQAIFEQAADSIVVSDVETNAFLMFNQKAYQNLGYTAEEFDNLRISD